METHFILLASNITADGDCSHEIKRCLLLGRKAITNLESVLKSRDHLTNKSPYSQSYGFPVVMYGCASWTIKKAEHLRIGSFELWFWKKTLIESSFNSKEIKSVNPQGNQSRIFIGRTEAEVEAPILWPPDGRADSLKKTLMLGNMEGRRRRG